MKVKESKAFFFQREQSKAVSPPSKVIRTVFLFFCRRTGGKPTNSSCSLILLDSDCEDEPTRKVNTSRKRRFSNCLPEDEERLEEVRAF